MPQISCRPLLPNRHVFCSLCCSVLDPAPLWYRIVYIQCFLSLCLLSLIMCIKVKTTPVCFCQQEHSWNDGVTQTNGLRDQSLLTTQRQTMAPISLLLLGFLFSLLHSPEAQTIADFSSSTSSSSLNPDLPINSSPQPTKHTAIFRSFLPPRGRSDVPIRATLQDRLTTTNSVQQWQRSTHPSAQSTSFISALSTQNLSSGPVATQPTSSRARTDTASLALIRDSTRADATEKGSTPPLPTLSSSTITASADEKLQTAGNPELETVKETDDDDLQELGSGSIPSVTRGEDDSTVFLPTVDEMAQFQPLAQTAISEVSDIETPKDSVLTTTNKISLTPLSELSSTLSPVVTQATPRTVTSTGENQTYMPFFKRDKMVLNSKSLHQMCPFFHFFR